LEKDTVTKWKELKEFSLHWIDHLRSEKWYFLFAKMQK